MAHVEQLYSIYTALFHHHMVAENQRKYKNNNTNTDKTTLGQVQTDHISLSMTLVVFRFTSYFFIRHVLTYVIHCSVPSRVCRDVVLYIIIINKEIHKKYETAQGQRSINSKTRVETDGQMDGQTEAIALPTALMRSVITTGKD